VSYGSGPHFPVEVGSGAVTCTVTHCGSQVSSIKKSMPVQLGTYVPNAHEHVSKAHGIRAIMSQKDVRVGNVVNSCKACRQTATM
jgi:hypothetical protein